MHIQDGLEFTVQILRVGAGDCKNYLLYRNVWEQVKRRDANRGNKRKEKYNYQFVALSIEDSRCLTVVQHDAFK